MKQLQLRDLLAIRDKAQAYIDAFNSAVGKLPEGVGGCLVGVASSPIEVLEHARGALATELMGTPVQRCICTPPRGNEMCEHLVLTAKPELASHHPVCISKLNWPANKPEGRYPPHMQPTIGSCKCGRDLKLVLPKHTDRGNDQECQNSLTENYKVS